MKVHPLLPVAIIVSSLAVIFVGIAAVLPPVNSRLLLWSGVGAGVLAILQAIQLRHAHPLVRRVLAIAGVLAVGTMLTIVLVS